LAGCSAPEKEMNKIINFTKPSKLRFEKRKREKILYWL
jgi:hypothetical protein